MRQSTNLIGKAAGSFKQTPDALFDAGPISVNQKARKLLSTPVALPAGSCPVRESAREHPI